MGTWQSGGSLEEVAMNWTSARFEAPCTASGTQVATTAGVAGVALHQSVQIVQFVQEWHKDADILWSTQK